MKKMTALKQQMTTALSLMLVVMTIAVCTPDQALAQQKMRKGTAGNARQGSNFVMADGSVRHRNNAPQQGASPKTLSRVDTSNMRDLNDAAGRRAIHIESFSWGVKRKSGDSGAGVNQGRRNNTAVTGNRTESNRTETVDKNETITVGGSRTESVGGSTNTRQNRQAAGFLTTDPNGPTYTPVRHNSAGPSASTNSNLKYELKDVLVSGYRKPKTNLTKDLPGTLAKSRGK